MNLYNANRFNFQKNASLDIDNLDENYKSEVFISKEDKVPVLSISTLNTTKMLNSKYSVQKEMIKWISTITYADAFIVIGLGTGLQLEYLHSAYPDSIIFVYEPECAFLKTLSQHYNFDRVLTNNAIHILHKPEDIYELLIGGIISTVHCHVTPGYVNVFPKITEHALSVVKEVLYNLSSDWITQKSVVHNWYKNSILNMLSMNDCSKSLKNCISDDVIITGGGPGLEQLLETDYNNCFIIATDTSLPFLHKNNIDPDIVIGIDGRNISYLNYIGISSKTLFLFDFNYPHFITKNFSNKIFISSQFPFTAYFNSRFFSVPSYNSSVGNVGSVAVYFASLLNARELHTFGLDFSYPRGEPYVKDSYFYDYFFYRQQKTNTYLSNIFNFLCKYTLKYNSNYKLYTTPLLNEYEKKHNYQLNNFGYVLQNRGKTKSKTYLHKNNLENNSSISLSNNPINKKLINLYINDLQSAIKTLSSANMFYTLPIEKRNLILSITPLMLSFETLTFQERLASAFTFIENFFKDR